MYDFAYVIQIVKVSPYHDEVYTASASQGALLVHGGVIWLKQNIVSNGIASF